MGKKGKKGKGSGGKKKKGGKKKGKKGGEPKMTWKEALLAYQINIKEKQHEDVRYELRALQDKNERHKERNERLQNEQLIHMSNLLKQAKDFEKKLAGEDIVDKRKVIEVMMEKWEVAKQEERSVAELKELIARKEAEVVLEKRQVDYWTEYKNKGQFDHSTQIQLLDHELVDMQSSFDEMSGHLERAANQTKSEIQKDSEETLDKQKYLATEKAMAKMDKYSRGEVLDSDWLQREVAMHKSEVELLATDVEKLEQDNLEMMGDLFECTVDDLKISRNFYLTQFSDNDNLEESGILEIDLSKLVLADREADVKSLPPLEEAKPRPERTRPKSARLKAIEDKVNSLPVAMEEEEEDSEEESEFDGENGQESSEDGDPFNNYFHFDDEDFDDYLQLGPLELKLLNITGKKVKFFPPSLQSAADIEAKHYSPDDWPVTQPMLQRSLNSRQKGTPRRY